LHSDLPPHSLAGRAFGLMLTAFAQRHGYPCIEGGSGRITDAPDNPPAPGPPRLAGGTRSRSRAQRKPLVLVINVWNQLGQASHRGRRHAAEARAASTCLSVSEIGWI